MNSLFDCSAIVSFLKGGSQVIEVINYKIGLMSVTTCTNS